MEFRLATADDVRAIALMRWDTAARGTMPTQARDVFADAFVGWAHDVAATHCPLRTTRAGPR
jgi:hypothetical protein